MITAFGDKSFRSVFIASKNPGGQTLFSDFPLTQEVEGSSITHFGGTQNDTFSAEMC